MKKLLISAGFIVLLATSAEAQSYDEQLSSLAKAMAGGIESAGLKKIAVPKFADTTGTTSELGRFLSEEVSVDLVMVSGTTRKFSVVPLPQELGSLRLTGEGEQTKPLKTTTNLDGIIFGTVAVGDNEITVFGKVLSLVDGEVVFAERRKLPRTKELEAMIAQGVDAKPVSVTLQPKEEPTPPKAAAVPKGVSWKNGDDLQTLPVLAARIEKGTPDSVSMLVTFYFDTDKTIPKISVKEPTFIHRGKRFDLSKNFQIEGVDPSLILIKLEKRWGEDRSFRTSGRVSMDTKKMQFNWQDFFGIGKTRFTHQAKIVDAETQTCTITCKLSSGFYTIFDGTAFYLFEYVPEKSKPTAEQPIQDKRTKVK